MTVRRDVTINLADKVVERSIGRVPDEGTPPSQSQTITLPYPGDMRADGPFPVVSSDILYKLLVSESANRSNPVDLDGYTAEGNIYVFTSPDTYVSAVDFYLDDEFQWQDTEAPFDLKGDDPGFGAIPLDTTELSNAQHEVSADLDTTEGPRTAVAQFWVVNDVGPPSGIDVTPATLSSAVSSNPGGSTFLLANGEYSGSLPTKPGNTYFGKGSSVVFEGPGISGSPWYNGGDDNISLYHLKVRRYGPGSNNGALNSNSAHDWYLEDCDFRYTIRTMIRPGNNWHLKNCHIQYCGEFAMGSKCNYLHLENVNWWDCGNGAGGVPQHSTSDRGGCKFVLSKGHHLEGMDVRRCDRQGIWYDIANEDCLIENFYVEDIASSGIDLEISYGPFTVRNGLCENGGYGIRNNEVNWGGNAGVGISLTPDVYVYNVTVRDWSRGLTCVQWDHPVMQQGKSVYNTTWNDGMQKYGVPGQSLLGLDDILFENCTTYDLVNKSTKPTIPYAAGRWGGLARYDPNNDPTRGATRDNQTIWRNCNFEAGSNFGPHGAYE